jgi:FkbM family methyltransferase
LGLEVRRLKNANVESQVLNNILSRAAIDVVLDVGANTGQYGDLLLRMGFRGTVISFEAIPSVHRILARRANAKSSSWIIAPCAALGSQRGYVQLNIAANSVSSSVLPMRSMHLEAAPQSKYVEQQTVPVERLDELALQMLPSLGRLLIKVDTQGYEMEVLKGAEGLLQRTAAIQLELSLVPLYEGAPKFVDMIAYVESKGFELFSLVSGFSDRRIGRLLQVDGFFVRPELISPTVSDD